MIFDPCPRSMTARFYSKVIVIYLFLSLQKRRYSERERKVTVLSIIIFLHEVHSQGRMHLVFKLERDRAILMKEMGLQNRFKRKKKFVDVARAQISVEFEFRTFLFYFLWHNWPVLFMWIVDYCFSSVATLFFCIFMWFTDVYILCRCAVFSGNNIIKHVKNLVLWWF